MLSLSKHEAGGEALATSSFDGLRMRIVGSTFDARKSLMLSLSKHEAAGEEREFEKWLTITAT